MGIRRRLDYLVSPGVDAIWISPVYPSLTVDFGYDVADYCVVDPRFGSLADFDDLHCQLTGRPDDWMMPARRRRFVGACIRYPEGLPRRARAFSDLAESEGIPL